MDRRLFGRRKGRPLRPQRQNLLDTLLHELTIDVEEIGLCKNLGRELCIEIGFGSGEHLIWQAQNNSKNFFIGSEVYINGISRLLLDINEKSLKNIRLWIDDGRLLLEALPNESVDVIYILFPDPWPKTRHHKRRIIGPSTVYELARVLKPGGILRTATDVSEYKTWMLQHILNCGEFSWEARRPIDWLERPIDWPVTRYEIKALGSNRNCAYFSFKRNTLKIY